MSEELYKQKYFKYKAKHLSLKKTLENNKFNDIQYKTTLDKVKKNGLELKFASGGTG